MNTILTDDEISKISSTPCAVVGSYVHTFARAIEAAVLAKLREQEPVAMRYDFDGYGYRYIDSGSGSDWRTRIPDAEAVYADPLPAVVQVPQQTAEPVRYAFFAGDGEVLFEPDPNGNWVRYSEVMGASK